MTETRSTTGGKNAWAFTSGRVRGMIALGACAASALTATAQAQPNPETFDVTFRRAASSNQCFVSVNLGAKRIVQRTFIIPLFGGRRCGPEYAGVIANGEAAYVIEYNNPKRASFLNLYFLSDSGDGGYFTKIVGLQSWSGRVEPVRVSNIAYSPKERSVYVSNASNGTRFAIDGWVFCAEQPSRRRGCYKNYNTVAGAYRLRLGDVQQTLVVEKVGAGAAVAETVKPLDIAAQPDGGVDDGAADLEPLDPATARKIDTPKAGD